MQKEQAYRYLAILSPIVSVLCAGGLAFFEFRRLQDFQLAVSVTQKKIAVINQALKDYQMAPVSKQVPTAERGPHEQSMFLDNLRLMAINSHVQITRIANSEAPPPAPPPPPSTDPNVPTPPAKFAPGVGPVTSSVEVSGNQFNVRRFMYGVQRAPRLMNLTDLRWVRDNWPNTHLVFTLTRYVGPPAAPGTPGLPRPVTGTPRDQTGLNSTQSSTENTSSSDRSTADSSARSSVNGKGSVNITSQSHRLVPGTSHAINGTTTGLEEGVNKLFKASDKQTSQGAVLSPASGNAGSGSSR